VIETKLREGTGRPTDSKRVRVMSVGTARAASARVIADGFGLHPEDAIARIYRAPSVLVDNVNTEVADQLVGLLSDIGLEVSVGPHGTWSEIDEVAGGIGGGQRRTSPREGNAGNCSVEVGGSAA
jgi:hypothetical protein